MTAGRVYVAITTAFFSSALLCAQQLPSEVKLAKTVFIENRAEDRDLLPIGNSVMAPSRLKLVDDRDKADLIFAFNRKTEVERTVHGNFISIGATDTYFLEVMNTEGKIYWKDSAVISPATMLGNKRVRHPYWQLIDKFLKAPVQN